MRNLILIVATVLYPPLMFVGFVVGMVLAPLVTGFLFGYRMVAQVVLESYSDKVKAIVEKEQASDVT